MEAFDLPRAVNIAVLDVSDQMVAPAAPDAGPAPAVARAFRYHNGGLLAVPPGRLGALMAAWQAAYERLASRIHATPAAAALPRVEDSALRSDQLALAIALAWETVHPLDPSCNFFLFDSRFGYAAEDVAILHLAGPVSGQGLPAVLASFDALCTDWSVDPQRFPRFDPLALRAKLAALVRDYAPGGAAWLGASPTGDSAPFQAPSAAPDSAYDDPGFIEAAVAQGRHRDVVGGMWDEIGRLQFDHLKGQGLRSGDHLLDIGCGSLRGGVRFAAYLEPGHYWGVDSNAALLRAGRRELEAAGLSDRVPEANLLEEAEFDFERLGRDFDIAIAQSLFTHLPANRIALCLYRLAKVMRPGGRLFATYLEVPETHPLDAPFHHPGGVVSHGHKDPFHYRASAIPAFIGASPWRLVAASPWGHPRDQRMMVLERLSIASTVARTIASTGVSSDIPA